MKCSSCHVGEVELKEISMTTKVFHLNSSGKKEQPVDTVETSITIGHCDYCHVMLEFDLEEERVKPIHYRTTEEVLDELGIET